MKLTLVQLLGFLLQKLCVFQLCQLVYCENMESGYSLMTLYVLHDPDMTLIGEILTDTSSSVPYETMRVSKSS